MIIALFDAFSRDPVGMAKTHQPIVDALVSRDPAAARAALHVHLDDAWQHVRGLFVTQHGAAPTMPKSKRPRIAKEPTS
jgi:DNA-binding GntR family transcriptional regulator